MALYLVTCVYDEGVYENDFRVVEAESLLDVARHITQHPYRWADWLRRAYLWEEVRDEEWTPEELFEAINNTSVDGDSDAQMRIYEINEIERL